MCIAVPQVEGNGFEAVVWLFDSNVMVSVEVSAAMLCPRALSRHGVWLPAVRCVRTLWFVRLRKVYGRYDENWG